MVKCHISDSKGQASRAHGGGAVELGMSRTWEEDRKEGQTTNSTDQGRYESGSLPLTEPGPGGGGVRGQGRPLAGAGLGPVGKPSRVIGVSKGLLSQGLTCSELPWCHRAGSAGA